MLFADCNFCPEGFILLLDVFYLLYDLFKLGYFLASALNPLDIPHDFALLIDRTVKDLLYYFLFYGAIHSHVQHKTNELLSAPIGENFLLIFAVELLEVFFCKKTSNLRKDLEEVLILTVPKPEIIFELSEILSIYLQESPSNKDYHFLLSKFCMLLGDIEKMKQPFEEDHGASR